MSFLDFLGKLKPYVSPANIAKRALFQEDGITATKQAVQTTALDIFANRTEELKGKKRSEERKQAFTDSNPLVYPQDLFSKETDYLDPCILFHMKEPVFRDEKILKRIALYMPPNIKVNYGANWSEVDLFVSKDTAQNIRSETTKFLNNLQRKGTIEAISTAAKDIKAGDVLGTLAGTIGRGYAKKTLTGNSLGQAASAIAGKSINPMAGLSFSSVNPRTFTFDFELLARTQKESDDIRDIIGTFKYGMHPEAIKGFAPGEALSGYGDPIFLDYPKTFDIFLFAGFHSSYLFNFERCALTSVDVNYNNGENASFFWNGAPVNIGLSLTFKETELLTRDRVSKGY